MIADGPRPQGGKEMEISSVKTSYVGIAIGAAWHRILVDTATSTPVILSLPLQRRGGDGRGGGPQHRRHNHPSPPIG